MPDSGWRTSAFLRMNGLRYIVYASPVVLLVAFCVYEFTVRRPSESAPGSQSELISTWEKEIKKVGAQDAYADFSKSVALLSRDQQHMRAHAFGAALYRSVGITGLPTCDDKFSYGCFHEFLGEAIADLGIESVPLLNQECFRALSVSPLSCQHGIGHGVLAAYGYDYESLKQSLAVCSNLPGSDFIGGCPAGVFMEYNVRTMLGAQAEPREYTGSPYAPCDSFTGNSQMACIYWQPQWWTQTVTRAMGREEAYADMGGYCRKFGVTVELRRACFEGLGNIVTQQSAYDPVRARALCEKASAEPLQSLWCRSIGANHFGVEVGAKEAAAMCNDLTSEPFTYCMAYAKNEANAVRQLPTSL